MDVVSVPGKTEGDPVQIRYDQRGQSGVGSPLAVKMLDPPLPADRGEEDGLGKERVISGETPVPSS